MSRYGQLFERLKQRNEGAFGAFLMLGNGDTPMCHHPAFDFDDRALPVGASYFSRLIERALPLTE